MTIIDMLENNAKQYASDTALVEINPGQAETRRLTWRDYDLVESEKNTSVAKSPGVFSTKRLTALPMHSLPEASRKATRLLSS